jgi:DNA-binding XRE family transcriptional regulator
MTMNKAKQKRLEAKGWKVGDAADFLGLSPEEARYVEMKVEMGQRLRKLREGRNLTQAELAQRLHSSQSRVAKMEAGHSSVTLDLLFRSVFSLGASKRDLERAIPAP